jgi:integrase
MTTRAMDLRYAVTFHQLALVAEGRAPKTQHLYLGYQRAFLEYLSEQHIAPTFDALNSLNVRAALEWLKSRSSMGSRGGQVTPKQFIGILKTWSNFLEREGVLTTHHSPLTTHHSPLHQLRAPRVPKVLRQPFTAQEVMALWGASQQTRTPRRDEALLLLLLDTGLRIGEARYADDGQPEVGRAAPGGGRRGQATTSGPPRRSDEDGRGPDHAPVAGLSERA